MTCVINAVCPGASIGFGASHSVAHVSVCVFSCVMIVNGSCTKMSAHRHNSEPFCFCFWGQLTAL